MVTKGGRIYVLRSLAAVAMAVLLVLGSMTVLLALGSVDGSGQTRTRATITETSLKRSETLLLKLARTPQDAIPDAVVNRTQCLIVFPENGAEGVASCRQAPQTWYVPTAVALTGVKPRKGTDFLVFLLGSSAPKVLQTGALDLSSTTPGPLVRVSSL